jgi:hypothetical protein
MVRAQMGHWEGIETVLATELLGVSGMSLAGQSRRFDDAPITSGPPSGHSRCWRACLKSAISGSREPYSITSSARAKSIAGTSRPRAFAVFRLMTNSNLID